MPAATTVCIRSNPRTKSPPAMNPTHRCCNYCGRNQVKHTGLRHFGRVISTTGQTVTRAIRVVLSRSTFLNYGYFTNVETMDPQQYDLDPAQPGWPRVWAELGRRRHLLDG